MSSELEKIDKALENWKKIIFDIPKRNNYPMGEEWWENQAKELFKFTCELITILHIIECKMEKFGKELERVNYD